MSLSNDRYYDLERIVENNALLSNFTTASCFFYDSDGPDGVQTIIKEIDEVSAMLPERIELKDLPRVLSGDRRTKIYGKATCSATRGHLILQGDAAEDRVLFRDREVAEQLGFQPCCNCMPGK